MKIVVADAMGEYVHVARVVNSLRLDKTARWRNVFFGPPVPGEEFLKPLRHKKAKPPTRWSSIASDEQ